MTTPRAHDDLEAILSEVNTADDEGSHTVGSAFDALFTWDYAKGARPALDKLYEKAKTSQWNGATDLDWSIDVDPERTAVELAQKDRRMQYVRALIDEPDSPVRAWGEKEITHYAMENVAHRVSQFLHGEQGALLCTARIVETVPWIDAKYYASTQVMDEARHVEVFGRYLAEKMATSYPINAHLRALIDDVLADSRWDITYLGMQIMIEGLALAAFGAMYQTTTEPLLRQLIRYVMSDEARHVAFGVLSLQEAYAGISAAELHERQEFVYEAALRMRDRFLHQEVWERLGVSARAMVPYFIRQNNEEEILFQRMLFAKIVPNCKKLGLLDSRDPWLRDRFTAMGVIEYEDHVDTSIEYSELNAIEADRAAAAATAR
jgi:P-aminobenzoate N-oxygenase AurF